MPVLKATEPPRAGLQRSAFNFDDLSQQADAYLLQVRARANDIVQQAQREAAAVLPEQEARVRQAAERTVQQRALQLAGELVHERVQTLLPALEQAVSALRQAREEWLAHWEQQALCLASAIAARVVRRELAQAPDIGRVLLREALELTAGSTHLRIRLNPADLESFGDSFHQLVAELAPRASAEWIGDSTVSPGGCVVETEHGRVDQRIETQLARIEQELAGM